MFNNALMAVMQRPFVHLTADVKTGTIEVVFNNTHDAKDMQQLGVLLKWHKVVWHTDNRNVATIQVYDGKANLSYFLSFVYGWMK